jgi:hypothetical protein
MPIDPGTATLATGGLSLVSGLFGSGMSNKSVKRSIKAAKEINQINNEFNASEALKNRDFQTSEREASQQWNLDQWNREKSSWKNNSTYYNIMELLKDILGPIGNAVGSFIPNLDIYFLTRFI